ncbi:MAG TPA: hypothetical protein VFM54_05730 [Micromonosporaceae bacterium]|nr:hypothetical protein [Micromonosporaceae bacterium]
MESAKQGYAVLTVLLTGIAVEVVLAFVKGEPLNLVRLGTLLGVIAAMVLVLYSTRRRASLRTVIAGVLFFLGLAAVTIGVLVLAGVAPVDSAVWANALGTTIVSSGVIVFLSGGYVLRQGPTMTAVTASGYAPVKANTTSFYGGDSPATLSTFPGYSNMEIIFNLCRHQLSTHDLHYVAYFTKGTCRFCVDVFEDGRLGGMIGEVSPAERRERYETYARLAHDMVRMLNHRFREVDAGHLIRLVLDVQKGAMYYFRIEEDRFLFGVTLNQEQVLETDAKMLRLVDQVAAALGHRPNPDFDRWDDDNVRPFQPRPRNGQAS